MNKKRKEIIAANEISEIRTYVLGGYSQKVLIEGKRKSNPIILVLHGGPGSPIPFGVGCRGLFPELTDQATIVYWDQLGCGINNHIISEAFTIDIFIYMTIDLIKHLKHDFKDNSISLFGMSWGSILAAKAAEAVPDLIHSVLVYGQVLKNLPFNDYVYDTLHKSSMPNKNKEKLLVMKSSTTHTFKEQKIVLNWIKKYTEGYQAKNGGKAPFAKIFRGIMSSPDYLGKDFKAILINGYLKNKSLLMELMKVDLSETLEKVKMPYLIIQGDTDIVTSTKMLSDYMETVDNSNLHLQIVENSGHLPSAVGMDVVINEGFRFLITM